MNIWIVLWVFISVFLLGISLWSLQILVRQRNVWQQFAKRHNMEVLNRGLMKSLVLKGMYNGLYIKILSEQVEGMGGREDGTYRTLVQFDLTPCVGVEGVISSPGRRDFAMTLGIPHDVVPAMEGWNKGILIRTQSEQLLKPYLTPERLQVLNNLMSVKNCNALFLFNEKESFFRFETPDPLDDVARMEKQITKIIDAAKVLGPKQ